MTLLVGLLKSEGAIPPDDEPDPWQVNIFFWVVATQIFFIFTTTWGDDPVWLIFSNGLKMLKPPTRYFFQGLLWTQWQKLRPALNCNEQHAIQDGRLLHYQSSGSVNLETSRDADDFKRWVVTYMVQKEEILHKNATVFRNCGWSPVILVAPRFIANLFRRSCPSFIWNNLRPRTHI